MKQNFITERLFQIEKIIHGMIIQITLFLIGIYLLAGFIFAIAFVLKGAQVIDEGANGGSIGFRIMIFPGSVVFWPMLLQRWRKQRKHKTPNMTKQLRRRHFQIWLLLLLILPLGIITARLVRPKPAVNQLLQPVSIPALPTLLQTYKNENYTVNIRKGNDTSQQLEWINNQILAVPTAVIYKTEKGSKSIENGEMVGRIEARGIYRFSMRPGPVETLLLYDFIHQQIIDTINF